MEGEDELPADGAQQVKQMHIMLCAAKEKNNSTEEHFVFTISQGRAGNKNHRVAPFTSVGEQKNTA